MRHLCKAGEAKRIAEEYRDLGYWSRWQHDGWVEVR